MQHSSTVMGVGRTRPIFLHPRECNYPVGVQQLANDQTSMYDLYCSLVMVTLCNRADHYIFALLFLSIIFLFSSPNLSGRRLDVYHTLTHGVTLVRI